MIASVKSSGDESGELVFVVAKNFRGFLVERVVGIGFQQQVKEAVNDRGDGEDWLPIFPQNVEADVPVEVDVGVVDLGLALDLGRVVGIERFDEEGKLELAAPPVPFVGADGDSEFE